MSRQDPALERITAWLTAKDAALQEASAEVFPLLESLVIKALVSGWEDEADLRRKLSARIQRDHEVKWHLVENLPDWWRQKRVREDKTDARIFVERCTDQVAAMLVFKNLDQCISANASNLDALLIQRVADRVICRSVKKKAREKASDRKSTGEARPGDDRILEGPPEPTEDEISTCVEAVCSAGKKFQFMGLGKAIAFFKTAARRKLFPRTAKSVSATSPLREEMIAAPETEDEEPDSDLSEERARAWHTLKSRLKEKDALRFWVLLALYEHGKGLEWAAIARLVTEPGWCTSRDFCCPPDTTPRQVEQAFRGWARRSGTLSAENLRQTYCRCRKAFRR